VTTDPQLSLDAAVAVRDLRAKQRAHGAGGAGRLLRALVLAGLSDAALERGAQLCLALDVKPNDNGHTQPRKRRDR
jgi:hypothetical protein